MENHAVQKSKKSKETKISHELFLSKTILAVTASNFHFFLHQLRRCPLSCHFQICNFFCCTTILRDPSNDPHFLKGGYLENL